MQALIHCSHSHSHSLLIFRNPPPSPSPSSLSAMSSSLTLPSFSPFFSNGSPRTLALRNTPPRSRVFMTLSAGSQVSVRDDSFADYKASTAFLFPGQVHCISEFGISEIETWRGEIDVVWWMIMFVAGCASSWNGKRSSECSCCCGFVQEGEWDIGVDTRFNFNLQPFYSIVFYFY